MSILTRVVLASEIADFLPDNTTREINEKDVRDRLLNQNDSLFHVVDGLGFSDYEGSVTYNPDDFVTSGDKVYKKIGASEGGVAPPNPSSWEDMGSEIFMSETEVGLTRIATQAEVDGATNDLYAVTPLKLGVFVDTQIADLIPLRTLTGTSTLDTDLGTFANGIISNSNTIKGALQELESELFPLRALTGTSTLDINLGTFTNGIISNSTTIKNALQELESELFPLRTLTGTSALETDLGTFTNGIISNSNTIKGALQELESELAVPENRVPFGAPLGGGLLTAGLQFNGNNLTLGSDPALDGLATNNFAMEIGTPTDSTPLLDSFSLYAKNYKSDGRATPYILTEDGYEIDLRSGGQDVFKFVNETNIDTSDVQLVAGLGFFEEDFTVSNSINASTLTFQVGLMPVAAGDPIVYESKATVGGTDPNTSVNAWILANITGDRFSDDAFFIRPIYDFRVGDENKKGVILLRYNYL